MEKQAKKTELDLAGSRIKNDATSRILLIAIVVLYSLALVLLANLALARGAAAYVGALIKVNSGWEHNLASLNVKSAHGNVLAVALKPSDEMVMRQSKGIHGLQMDHRPATASADRNDALLAAYAYTGVVIGVLDNTGNMSPNDLAGLMKIDADANIGFASYRSQEPGSTVIMRNLETGESNLLQALAYMSTYAQTVGLPLVVELLLSENAQCNLLFVQACQSMAEGGIQFIGRASVQPGQRVSNAPVQVAFSLIDTETGTVAQRTDFWGLNEMRHGTLKLTGTDGHACQILFDGDNGFDKVFLNNGSANEVMVTALTADGDVHYYRVARKETALIPRVLQNGLPVLEDGSASIYPFHTKPALFNQGTTRNQFVQLSHHMQPVTMAYEKGTTMEVASPTRGTLSMTVTDLHMPLSIELRDTHGKVVYKNRPDAGTKRITARIDLSEGQDGLYFLDLRSGNDYRSLALMVE